MPLMPKWAGRETNVGIYVSRNLQPRTADAEQAESVGIYASQNFQPRTTYQYSS